MLSTQRVVPGRGEGNPLPSEVSLINQKIGRIYAYSAAAFGITFASAIAFAKNGFAMAVLSVCVKASVPMTFLVLLAVGVGLIATTYLISKERSTLRHSLYGLFAVWEGLVVSPLVLLNAPAFAAAAVTTVVLTGGLGVMAMVLKESFEKYERILGIALGIIVVASLGALVLPTGAAAFAHEISLIGGIAVFGCLVIYDTHRARSRALAPEFDEINHSMHIYLDVLNLFVRMWEVFERINQVNQRINIA